MLKMKIQLFADGDDKQDVPFKAFATEEEFNEFVGKQVQSASSKAKGEILSELGIKSVNDAKEKFSALNELDSLRQSYTQTNEKYQELESKYNSVIEENTKTKEALVLTKYKVPETFQQDFLVLAKAGVKEKTEDADGVSFEEAAKQVYERLNLTKVNNKIVIGGEKKPKEQTDAQIKKMRAMAGLKN